MIIFKIKFNIIKFLRLAGFFFGIGAAQKYLTAA